MTTIAENDRITGPLQPAAGATSLSTDFPVFEEGDLVVLRRGPGSDWQRLTVGVDYTLSGLGNDAGATVQLTQAVQAGEEFLLVGAMQPVPGISYVQGQQFSAAATNEEIARLWAAIQELRRATAQHAQPGAQPLLLPPGEQAETLPARSDRAARVLGFDADGHPVAMQSRLEGWRGEWAASVDYQAGDVVSYSGSSWVAIANHTSDDASPPPSGGKWMLLAEKGDTNDALTYADLKLVDGTANPHVMLAGRTTPGDGGGGLFEWVPGDHSADVAADTLEGIWVASDSDPTGASGAWRRRYDGVRLYPEWWGAVGDAATDDKQAFDAMANYMSSISSHDDKYTLVLRKVYRINGDWKLPGNFNLLGYGSAGFIINGRIYLNENYKIMKNYYKDFSVWHDWNVPVGTDIIEFITGIKQSVFSNIRLFGIPGRTKDGMHFWGKNPNTGVANANLYTNLFSKVETKKRDYTATGYMIGAAINLDGREMTDARANGHVFSGCEFDYFSYGVKFNGNGNTFIGTTFNRIKTAAIYAYGDIFTVHNAIINCYFDGPMEGDEVVIDLSANANEGQHVFNVCSTMLRPAKVKSIGAKTGQITYIGERNVVVSGRPTETRNKEDRYAAGFFGGLPDQNMWVGIKDENSPGIEFRGHQAATSPGTINAHIGHASITPSAEFRVVGRTRDENGNEVTEKLFAVGADKVPVFYSIGTPQLATVVNKAIEVWIVDPVTGAKTKAWIRLWTQ